MEVLISAFDLRLLAKDMEAGAEEQQGKWPCSYPGTKMCPIRELAPVKRIGSLEVVASPGPYCPGMLLSLYP